LYGSVRNNLFGEDKQDALTVIDDDDAFDRWMEEFERRQQLESAARASVGKPCKSSTSMSKDEFLTRYDCVFDPTKG
jgi:hypothetical protein